MKISINDWMGNGPNDVFKGTRFESRESRFFDGTIDDAFKIAQELFSSQKLNVSLLHRETAEEKEMILIWVTNKPRFAQYG